MRDDAFAVRSVADKDDRNLIFRPVAEQRDAAKFKDEFDEFRIRKRLGRERIQHRRIHVLVKRYPNQQPCTIASEMILQIEHVVGKREEEPFGTATPGLLSSKND